MIPTGNILVIDDEESLRHTLARVLRQVGYDVTTAAEGHEALRLFNATKYDVIYLDIRLPGMDGMQILKEIRDRDLKMPVILLTAYGSLQTAIEALRLGATDYLLKPIDPEVLVARTRIILEEQAIERRQHEIRQQIASLQEELRSLEGGYQTPFLSAPTPAPQDRFLKRGPLILDLQARRATFRDRVLVLPPAAFDYLVVLARHSPDIVHYQTLVAEAQGYRATPAEARQLSKWHIHALRHALETAPTQPQYLINVRGTGYRLVTD